MDFSQKEQNLKFVDSIIRRIDPLVEEAWEKTGIHRRIVASDLRHALESQQEACKPYGGYDYASEARIAAYDYLVSRGAEHDKSGDFVFPSSLE